MRSDTCMTIGMSCSTKRMVTPDARTASTNFMTFAVSLGFMPDTGSSSSNMEGCAASAKAMPSRRCFRDLLPRQRQQRIPQARPSPAVQSDQHIFEYRVVLKYARALERPDQAEACDFVRLEAVQQCLAIANFAGRGFE